MILLNNEELKNINGGSISGTLISSIVKGISLIFDLGRSLGSAIYRVVNKKCCKA
ncbi:MAG: bacteriocin [Bacilli bacterium]|nr:bacteriocin [Bacilli bacterium]